MKSAVVLGDLCDLLTDGTHYTPPPVPTGVPFLTVKDMTPEGLDFLNCSRISPADFAAADRGNSAPKRGDVLFSKDGTVGKVHVVRDEPPFAVLSSIAILRPNSHRLDACYLGHALRSPDLLEKALQRRTGSALRRIILKDLQDLRIPVPPLDEQRRIAAILDEADALRAKRRAVLAQLDEMARAIFLELFDDAAVTEGNWPVRLLGDLVHVKGGKRLPKGDTYSSVPTPFRYIRVSDIDDGRIDEARLVYLRPDTQKAIARYTVDEGDVVISIAGSIGLIAPVPASLAGANLTENAAKLVPKSQGQYDPIFLASFLQTPFAQEQIGARIGQVTIGKLALFRIEQLPIPLPPIELQRVYVKRLNALQQLRSMAEAAMRTTEALFTSLQHRAFRGEL